MDVAMQLGPVLALQRLLVGDRDGEWSAPRPPSHRMGRAHLGTEEWRRVESRSSPVLAPGTRVQELAKEKGQAGDRERQEGTDGSSAEGLRRKGQRWQQLGASETSLQVPFGVATQGTSLTVLRAARWEGPRERRQEAEPLGRTVSKHTAPGRSEDEQSERAGVSPQERLRFILCNTSASRAGFYGNGRAPERGSRWEDRSERCHGTGVGGGNRWVYGFGDRKCGVPGSVTFVSTKCWALWGLGWRKGQGFEKRRASRK